MKIPPKGSQFRRILTFSTLQTAAVVISLSCVIAYMVHNDLSKGRWAFFIFISCLALMFAVVITMLYANDIPRRHANMNWSILLSVPAIILAILLFIGAVVISVHIDQNCMEYCALATVAAVSAFFLTFLFLLESLLVLFAKSHEEKSRSEAAMVRHMESQIT